jgi:hypothetical protein
MKITKKQLKRIIREERARLVEYGDYTRDALQGKWPKDDPDPSSHEDFAPGLYVNLTDEQASGLDELEVLVGRLLDIGTQNADILDTVTGLTGTGGRS